MTSYDDVIYTQISQGNRSFHYAELTLHYRGEFEPQIGCKPTCIFGNPEFC